MRLPSALLPLALLAAPAPALDIIELKSGKILEVEEASVEGDRLRVRLATRPGQYAATTFPLDKVVPEFVFYVWAAQLADGDAAGHLALADWARTNGLFRHALRIYDVVAGLDEEFKSKLPALVTALKEEEATWHYVKAEQLFKEGEVHAARLAAETVLEHFKDSKEAGRAAELLTIIKEREQFLGEEKVREERAKRARQHKRLLDRHLSEISRADALVDGANLRYVQDARYRLKWAGYAYVRAAVALGDLLPFVEVDELRRMVEAHLDILSGRIVRTYLRLADLRYLSGDLGGALDAIHQILDLEPDNDAAAKLRERILDGPGPVHVRHDGGFLTHRRRLYYPTPYYGCGTRLRIVRAGHPYPYPWDYYGGNSFHQLTFPTGLHGR